MSRTDRRQRGLGGNAKLPKKTAVRKRWWSSAGTHVLVALLGAVIALLVPKIYNHFFVPDNSLEASAPPALNSLQEVNPRIVKADSQDFASVFHHRVQVKNKGNQTAFNVKLSIEPSSKDEDLQLEKVSTSPSGWEHIVNARDSTMPQNPYVHIVELDQLDPQQTVILDYVGRSKSYIPTSYLAVKAAAKEYKEMVRPGPGLILSGYGRDDVRPGWQYFTTTVPPNYGSYIDVADCNLIYGWAADQNHPNSPVSVNIYDGELLLRTVAANGWRSDTSSYLGDTGLHGFIVPAPASLQDPLTILGWTEDGNRANPATKVTLYDGSTPVVTEFTDESRPQVSGYVGDNGVHGFSIRTPSSLKDGLPHSLSVKFDSSSNSPLTNTKTLSCSTTPQIDSIDPNPVPLFNANQSVQVFGNNFRTNLIVDLSGTEIGTLSGSGQVQNVWPRSFMMAISRGSNMGTFGIDVVNPGGVASTSSQWAAWQGDHVTDNGDQNGFDWASDPARQHTAYDTQTSTTTVADYSWPASLGGKQSFSGTIIGTNFVFGGTQVWFCVNGPNTCYQQPPDVVTVNNSSNLSMNSANLGRGSWQIYVQPSAASSAFNVPASPPTLTIWSWSTSPTANQSFSGTINGTNFAVGGGHDAFVTKLDPQSSMLVYSTYLGGTVGVAELGFDAPGNAYVTGDTTSTDFPSVSQIQSTSWARLSFVNENGLLNRGIQNVSKAETTVNNSTTTTTSLSVHLLHFHAYPHRFTVYLFVYRWRAKPTFAETVLGSNQLVQQRRPVDNRTSKQLSNQDQTLRIQVLENGGARLEVRSFDERKFSNSLIPGSVRPLKVNILNSGSSQLSISTLDENGTKP